eukprot:7864801-Ditylum_brightwellii.AAC.1
MWIASPSGSGMRCWFDEWVTRGFQKGLDTRSFLRSKTTFDTIQNLVGAGDDPNGWCRSATVMFWTAAMHAVVMRPCVCKQQ